MTILFMCYNYLNFIETKIILLSFRSDIPDIHSLYSYTMKIIICTIVIQNNRLDLTLISASFALCKS